MAHLCFIIEPKPRQPPKVDEKIVESWPKEDGRAPSWASKCTGTCQFVKVLNKLYLSSPSRNWF